MLDFTNHNSNLEVDDNNPSRVQDEMEHSRLERIAVLISGNGSNLQAILDATHNGPLKH